MFTKTLFTLLTDEGFRVLEIMPIFQKSDRGHLCMPENFILHEQLLQIEHSPCYTVASNLVFLGALIIPQNSGKWSWHGRAHGLNGRQFDELISFILHYKMPHLKDIGIYD